MEGRLENQIKIEKKINSILSTLPKEVTEYYLNFSISKEFRTCYEYIKKLNKFFKYYASEENINVMDIKFNNISDIDIAKFMKLIETKESGDEIVYTSFSYRKQFYSIFNSFFSFLDKKRYIDSNPVRLIDRPTKKDKVTHTFLKKEDLDLIIESVLNGVGSDKAINKQKEWKERDLAIVYTFIYTGMRESALCEIDIDKVDLENGILTVIDKEHKFNTYKISSKLKRILEDWILKRKELLGDTSCDALFISNRKARLNQESVRILINKYSEEALGKKVSPHRLRAAYGNLIYEKTHDIELTSRAMKHSDISTTRIYLESDEEKINNKVANMMDNIF